jgi:ribonuclease T1
VALAQPGRSTTSLVASVLVLLAALVAWWLQGGRDDDDAGSAEPSYVGTHDPAPSDRGPTATAPGAEMPDRDDASGLPFVALADLPPEAAATVELIDAGGPFPYDEDGSRFGNYEGILPDRHDGYYREYTVETPGSPDRGARRIVAGVEGELYWTEDHYESFEVIWR